MRGREQAHQDAKKIEIPATTPLFWPARGAFIQSPIMRPIYLDFNSTAPVLPEVAAAMAQAESLGYANPASQHSAGRQAHRVLEETREEIAQLLGADLTGH